MKSKITYLFILFGLIATTSDAFTIVMSGGGRKAKYDYVSCTSTALTCTGNGNLICPVLWGYGEVKGTGFQLGDVIDNVFERISHGEINGAYVYRDIVDISWRKVNDDTWQIEVDADKVVVDSHE